MSRPEDPSPGAPPGPQAQARRGDLVVIYLRTSDWSTGKPRGRDEYHLGRVTSVTREGSARRYQPAGTLPGAADYRGRPDPGRDVRGAPGFQRVYVVSADDVDVDGALATAACHTWPGHEATGRAYPALGEVHAAIMPHRKDQPGWERLHEAALAWQRRRAEARTVLDTAGFPAYQEAVAAANDAYRQALAGRPVPGQDREPVSQGPRPTPRYLSTAGEAGRYWYAVHGAAALKRILEEAARRGVPLDEGPPPDLDGAPAALRGLRDHALDCGWDTLVIFGPSATDGGTWSLRAANPAVRGAVIFANWDNGKRAQGDSAARGSLGHLRDAISAAPRHQAEPAPAAGPGTEPER